MAENDDGNNNQKLLVTVAAKVDEKTARRIRAIATASGMSDSQIARLILERAMTIFKSWDPRINPAFFVEQFEIREEQLSLFFGGRDGFERFKR